MKKVFGDIISEHESQELKKAHRREVRAKREARTKLIRDFNAQEDYRKRWKVADLTRIDESARKILTVIQHTPDGPPQERGVQTPWLVVDRTDAASVIDIRGFMGSKTTTYTIPNAMIAAVLGFTTGSMDVQSREHAAEYVEDNLNADPTKRLRNLPRLAAYVFRLPVDKQQPIGEPLQNEAVSEEAVALGSFFIETGYRLDFVGEASGYSYLARSRFKDGLRPKVDKQFHAVVDAVYDAVPMIEPEPLAESA